MPEPQNTPPAPNADALTILTNRLLKLESRFDENEKKIAKGWVNPDQLEQTNAELKTQINDLRAQIASLKKPEPEPPNPNPAPKEDDGGIFGALNVLW